MSNKTARALVLALASVAGTAAAATIDVPATAPTIVAGLAMAAPGDTVMVAPGIYAEHVTIPSGVSLIGADPLTTIIDGGGIAMDVVRIVAANNVRLEGFTIRGAVSGGGLPGGAGVFVNMPTAPIVIQNCRITGNDFGIGLFNTFSGSGPSILDCSIFANNYHGISNPGNGLVARNLIYSNALDGIHIDGSSSAPIVENNTFFGNTMNGVNYWNDVALTLRSNIFMNNGQYGVREFAPGTFVDPVLENNLFFSNVAGNYFDVQSGMALTSAASIDALAAVTGTVVGDPLLCNPPVDFGLGSGSPAIGMGVSGRDIGARPQGCAPTCMATGPMSVAAGNVTIALILSSSTAGAVDVTLEFSTSAGATWQLCTPAATSPLAVNPATGVAIGMTSFHWDTVTDSLGLGGISAGILVRASITDGLPATCTTAPFDVLNSLCGGICGDCDSSGAIPSILDALTAAQIAVGIITPTMTQMSCCDINDSGDISITDALGMAQSAAGIPVILTCP